MKNNLETLPPKFEVPPLEQLPKIGSGTEKDVYSLGNGRIISLIRRTHLRKSRENISWDRSYLFATFFAQKIAHAIFSDHFPNIHKAELISNNPTYQAVLEMDQKPQSPGHADFDPQTQQPTTPTGEIHQNRVYNDPEYNSLMDELEAAGISIKDPFSWNWSYTPEGKLIFLDLVEPFYKLGHEKIPLINIDKLKGYIANQPKFKENKKVSLSGFINNYAKSLKI